MHCVDGKAAVKRVKKSSKGKRTGKAVLKQIKMGWIIQTILNIWRIQALWFISYPS